MSEDNQSVLMSLEQSADMVWELREKWSDVGDAINGFYDTHHKTCAKLNLVRDHTSRKMYNEVVQAFNHLRNETVSLSRKLIEFHFKLFRTECLWTDVEEDFVNDERMNQNMPLRDEYPTEKEIQERRKLIENHEKFPVNLREEVEQLLKEWDELNLLEKSKDHADEVVAFELEISVREDSSEKKL